MLSGRLGATGRAAGRAPALDPGLRLRLPAPRLSAGPPAVHPVRAAAAGLAVVLTAAVGLAVPRLGAAAGHARARAPAPSSTTFAGVSYGLVGVEVTRRIPQRGAGAVQASGVFEIVKLALRAADRRPHLVSSDLLTLEAGPTYYGVSSPDDIGLADRRWGAATTSMAVPTRGVLTIKAVFDVPPAVARLPAALHIGSFGYVGQPSQTLGLPDRGGCCPGLAHPNRRTQPLVGPLTPSPVLGGR